MKGRQLIPFIVAVLVFAWGILPGTALALHVNVTVYGTVHVLELSGKLTIGEGDVALRYAIHEQLSAGVRNIVLDMAGVSTIDSSGVGELVSSYTSVTNRGGRMVLSRVPPKVRQVMDITRLSTIFDIYETVEAAVASFHK